MPTETETNESKPEIETQKLTTEMKIRKYSKELKVLHPFFFFFALCSSNHCFISSKR